MLRSYFAIISLFTVTLLTLAAPRPAHAQLFGAYMEDQILHAKLSGRMVKTTYTTPALRGKRDMYVYTPPGYSTAASPYPVIIFLHGSPGGMQDWPYKGNAHKLLDDAIKGGKFPAAIAVFVDAKGPFWKGGSEYADSADGRCKMETALSTDLPHYLMANYNVSKDPAKWVVGGLSEGGFGAANLVLHHPNVFRNALMFSGDTSVEEDWPDAKTVFGNDPRLFMYYSPNQQIHHLSADERKKLHFYIAVGADDNVDLVSANESFAAICRSLGVTVRYDRDPGKHKWEFWSSHLAASLPTVATWLRD